MSTLTLDELLSRLDHVKRASSGWSARCPAHHDRQNSLSIAEADGKVLLKCHAGCLTENVLRALGLGWPELFDHSSNRGGSAKANHRAPADPLDWWSQYCAVPPDFVRTLPLAAEDGKLAFLFPGQTVRKLRARGSKNYAWHPAGAPTPPLWPLPQPTLPARLWLTEGESDCTVLRFCGLDAFSVTRGAGGELKRSEAEALVARGVSECVIVFDADQAGRDGAKKLVAVLAGGGLSVRVVDLAGAGLVDPLAGQKDVRDAWIAAGRDPAAFRAALEALAAEAPIWETADDAPGEATAPAPSWPEPLNEAAYHGLAGEVVRALAPFTEADPVALLASFLAAFGACLGRAAYCQVGADRHAFKIWSVLVGATSKGRKGSSWSPIRELFSRADPDFAANRIVSGLSSGEGVIWAVRDPVLGHERVKDGGEVRYVETEVDPGVKDKRLLVIEEEFSSPLRILGREGNTLSPVLRQAWDRGDLRILTKNSPAKATGAHIVVIGHAVAEEVRRYLAESEMAGGFGNRFLWLCVRRSQCLPRGAIVEPRLLGHLAERVRRAITLGRTLGRIAWRDEAGREWDAIYPALSEGKPGLVGAIIARMEAHALRLAGLYAVLDGQGTIELPHLRAALAIVDYAEASAKWLFGEALGDPVADEILQALGEHHEMSRNAIYNLFDRHVSRERITRTLRTLQAAGLVTMERQETGGRPVEVWSVCRP